MGSTRKIEDTIILDFTTHNPSTGAVQDADAIPTYEVFEDTTDAALLSLNSVKRAGKTGNYRASVDATTINGFEVGKSYNVIVSATVNVVSAKARIAAFTLDSKRNADLNDLSQTQIVSDSTAFLGEDIGDIKAKTDTIVAGGATEANVTDVHGHVATIDGHIAADYTATEKSAIDLLDDAVGGLLDIHTDVGAAITDVAAVKAETVLIVADTGELQTDLHDGGRLDLLVDAIKAKTDVIVSGGATATGVTAVEDKVDIIDTNVDSILADTNELQTDLVNGGRLDLLIDGIKSKTDTIVASGATEANVDAVETKVDTVDTVVDAIKLKTDIIGATVALEAGGNIATILADTNELQTDLVDGGRLDLLIDGIKAKTDVIVAGGATETNVTTAVNDIAAVHVHVGTIDSHVTADYTATEKAAIDLLDDAVGGLLDVHTDVADVHTDVGTVTSDVAAVHVHVGTIDGHITADYTATEKAAIDLLDDAAGGLLDIHTDVGTAITAIGDVHATDLPAVKAETALIVADTNELQTDLVDGGRLDLLIDAIKAKTDVIVASGATEANVTTAVNDVAAVHVHAQTIETDVAAVHVHVGTIDGHITADYAGAEKTAVDRIARFEITRLFFSATDDIITCNTDSSDLTLPSVVLPNITGTITHVYAGIKFRMIENTNAGTNGLNGAQDVQVKESVAGAYTDAINLVDNQWLLAASTREGGDVCIGNIDIVAQVAAFNKTYNFIIDDNDVDQANLNLCDMQTFLVVTWY